MSGVRLADLRPAHRARVAAILDSTGVFTPAEIDVALELFDASVGHARSGARPTESDYDFLGAFTPDDRLVGYACWGPTPATDRTCDLYWLAVDPAVHGAGIGTTLLLEVERRLEGRHTRLLVVETSSRSDYAPTRRFYERHGYAEAARVRGFYAPGDDRIILTKRFQLSPDRRGALAS